VPFRGNTPAAVLVSHMSKEMPPTRELRGELSAHLEGALRRALAKTPSDRYPTAAMFVEALTPVDKSVGPLFPDANRHGFSVGATKTVGKKEFTLFYEALKFVDRTTNVAANNIQYTNGDYRNFAHVLGAGLRLVVGGPK